MANATGKAARRRLGNRYACKKHVKRNNPLKKTRWAQLDKERLRKEKRAGGGE